MTPNAQVRAIGCRDRLGGIVTNQPARPPGTREQP